MVQPRTQTTFLDDYLVCAREARTLTLRGASSSQMSENAAQRETR